MMRVQNKLRSNDSDIKRNILSETEVLIKPTNNDINNIVNPSSVKSENISLQQKFDLDTKIHGKPLFIKDSQKTIIIGSLVNIVTLSLSSILQFPSSQLPQEVLKVLTITKNFT